MRSPHDNHRDRLLDEAIASGKFAEDRRPHYAAMYDRDPAGTEGWIAALVSVPTTGLAAASAPYPRELFPELMRAQGLEPVRGGLAPRTEMPHVRPAAPAAVVETTPELVTQWTDQLFPEAAAARALEAQVQATGGRAYPAVMSDGSD
jgi:hypothetical protein